MRQLNYNKKKKPARFQKFLQSFYSLGEKQKEKKEEV